MAQMMHLLRSLLWPESSQFETRFHLNFFSFPTNSKLITEYQHVVPTWRISVLFGIFLIFTKNTTKTGCKTTKNTNKLPDKQCSVMDIWASGNYASGIARPSRWTLIVLASMDPWLANLIHRLLRVFKLNIFIVSRGTTWLNDLLLQKESCLPR